MAHAPSKFDTAPFVAWDGEGYTTSRGHHRYWLLGTSDGAELESRQGLATRAALPWIGAQLGRRSDAIHVAFSFSYDVNMLLRDVPRATLARIHAGERVRVGLATVQYQSRKRLSVTTHDFDAETGEWRDTGGVIWDVWGFFQSSFVKALASYSVLGADERARIAEMKAVRRTFSWEHREEVRDYMQRELAALVQLMDRVRAYARDAGIWLARWDGAGAVASALLKREVVKPHKARSSAAIETAARHAYFGGRIEAVHYGHTAEMIHQYDLRSAYPAALQRVPSLAGATWRNDGPGIGDDFALARVRWHFTHGEVLPLPWRAETGAIFYPSIGEGWVWWPELDAARSLLAAGAIGGRIDVLDAWTCDPASDVKPFAFVPQLYQQRAEWKAQGRGAEKMLKLGLNSLYGKTAQHVGGRGSDPPTWHQLEWAGYVTSRTRAALLTASLPAILSGDLVMYATDAVFSMRPLPLPDGGLGTWEHAEHEGATVVQSGVYWTGPMEQATERIRGFDPGALSRQGILDAWARGRQTVRGRSHRFLGMGRALAGGASWRAWCSWPLTVRVLQLHPLAAHMGKRHVLAPRRDVGTLWPTLPTDPHWWRVRQGRMSRPIALPWARDGVAPMPRPDADDDPE